MGLRERERERRISRQPGACLFFWSRPGFPSLLLFQFFARQGWNHYTFYWIPPYLPFIFYLVAS